MGRRRRARARHALVGALVQRAAPPRPLQLHAAPLVRSSLPRCPTSRPRRGWTRITRASTNPRAVHLRVVGEVELLQCGGVFEAGLANPAGEGGGVAPVDLVLAECLEELEVAELTSGGLSEARFEGVEHP